MKRNPIAKALSHGLFKNKVVKARKGKGSYKRAKMKRADV